MSAPNWICRSQTHDFGIDLEAELTFPGDLSEELSGALIKLQIKGTIKPKSRDNANYVRLRTDFIQYSNQFRIPIVLILVNVSTSEMHYLWLQEYFNGRGDQLTKSNSVLVRVPLENKLATALQHELPSIALGTAPGSQLIAVQRLFEAFSGKYDQEALELSSRLLRHLSLRGHTPILDATIEKLILHGPLLSRGESQDFGRILYNLCGRFGDQLSTDQVFRMVVRGQVYSLAGLDGLMGLYDNFPDHAVSLCLTEIFDRCGIVELSWYCRFREANLGINSGLIWQRIEKISTEFETPNGTMLIPIESREYCYSKWPSRADAVYLQALRPAR